MHRLVALAAGILGQRAHTAAPMLGQGDQVGQLVLIGAGGHWIVPLWCDNQGDGCNTSL